MELPPVAGIETAFRQLLERYTWQYSAGDAPSDVRLSVGDTVRLDYDADLYELATIERLAQVLLRLAEGVEPPSETVRGNETPYPEAAVHDLVAERARRQPDAVAVIAGRETLTYAELDAETNRLAHCLIAHDVGPESTVLLCVRRGLPMIVGLLGILKAGGAYVPLDPDYPAERLAFMARDSEASIMVTERELRETPGRLPGLPAVDLDDLAAWPADPPRAGVRPEHLAYVVYTSGSTGQPKGVQVEHRSLSARMAEMRDRYAITPADTMLQFSSISFDGALDQIFPPLLAGARIVLRLGRLDPRWLLAAMREHEITLCEMPPSVWALLIDRMADGDPLAGTLRLVGLAGEQLPPEQVRRWFGLTTVPLMNVYGPTEATVNATTAIIDGPVARVPIGRPLANTEVCVLDSAGRVAPAGAVGELLIGGVGVARGYLGRPELTARCFVTLAIGGVARRWYRTGDLALQGPDGQLEFAGRIDDQVKIGGHRIEIGEIESVLLRHPAVGAAAVQVREGRRLYAYCAPAARCRLGGPELREWCARSLPEFMVPSGVVVLDRLPLNSTGKIDRGALPEPDDQRPQQRVAYVAPSTPAEESLARIWAQVLGLNRVGARDSFFDLGGDSTLAVGLVARARQQGLRLSTRVVFESPILAEMAARTRGASGRVAGSWRPEVWRNRVSLVHLNAGPPSRTVFCIHEIGGNVTAYAEVAARLAAAAHLIGVEAGSAGLGREPGRDLLAMARTYAEAIRDIQPVGPYRLIGYSLGGAIAHAIAALMEAGGGSVELLAVVDSVLPVGPLTDTLRRYADRIDALAALPPGGLAKARPLARRLDLPEVVLTLPPDDLARRLHTMAAHTVALLTYRPIPIRSEVLLYQAGRSRWAMPLAEAWAPYCGRVDARTGPGDHLSIMRPPAIDGIADDLWAVLRLDPGAAGRR